MQIIDKILYHYLKPSDSPASTFYGQSNIYTPCVPTMQLIVLCGSLLQNLSKHIANTLKS